jgi:PAS domain S-box-containing protein
MLKKKGLMKQLPLVNEEVSIGDEEFIVSKTNVRGHIIYANRVFMEISLLSEDQLINLNHNIIRHPDMPKGVFKYVWSTIKKGQEFFGYVKNLRSDGRYYWVFANITPEYDQQGNLLGYLSVRRKPPASAIKVIEPIYQQMLSIERQAHSDKDAVDKSLAFLQEELKSQNLDYQDFVINLFHRKS